MDLATVLRLYPWEETSSPIDTLWEFSLPVSREEFWPYLIDTSALNQRMKLPAFQYQEREGKLLGKTKQAGFVLEWEELPWEWEYLKEISNARIYSKGFATRIRSRFFLEETGQNHCKVILYFGLLPRNFFFRLLLKIALPNLEKSFRKAFEEIVLEIHNLRKAKETNSLANFPSFEPNPEFTHPENIPLLLEQLKKKGVSEEISQKIFHLITSMPDSQVDRIKIKKLAEDWRFALDDLLFAFLWGCRVGLFTLSWDTICPHCRGVRKSIQKLGDLPAVEDCEVCEISFETTKQTALEITFHIHPSLRKVEKQIFCAAEPSKKNHILLTKSTLPERGFSLQLPLNEGTYRLRKKGEMGFHVIEISAKNTQSHFSWEDEFQEVKLSLQPEISFVNTYGKTETLVLEERKEDHLALRPRELFGYSEFRDIFSEEAIATNLELDIGIQTILFTDIVGSTRFYKQVGDHSAFREVSSHFTEAYQIIKEAKGAIVKTIGDSIMASFPTPVRALQASLGLQSFFAENKGKTKIRIRISIHQGNCLAVNLNSNIDFFGSTVNYAAKMQAKAGAGEVVFSEKIFRNLQVREFLKRHKFKVKKLDFSVLPEDKPKPVYLWKPLQTWK